MTLMYKPFNKSYLNNIYHEVENPQGFQQEPIFIASMVLYDTGLLYAQSNTWAINYHFDCPLRIKVTPEQRDAHYDDIVADGGIFRISFDPYGLFFFGFNNPFDFFRWLTKLHGEDAAQSAFNELKIWLGFRE